MKNQMDKILGNQMETEVKGFILKGTSIIMALDSFFNYSKGYLKMCVCVFFFFWFYFGPYIL